jgi:hypothetical protein
VTGARDGYARRKREEVVAVADRFAQAFRVPAMAFERNSFASAVQFAAAACLFNCTGKISQSISLIFSHAYLQSKTHIILLFEKKNKQRTCGVPYLGRSWADS